MEGRTKPDKLEGLSVLLAAVVLVAAAIQSLDDPISRQGIAVGVGTFGVILLGVWRMYASRLTPLTVPDLWLGVSLLLIIGLVVAAVVYATWPIDRELVAGFGPIVAICVLWALSYVVRSMLTAEG